MEIKGKKYDFWTEFDRIPQLQSGDKITLYLRLFGKVDDKYKYVDGKEYTFRGVKKDQFKYSKANISKVENVKVSNLVGTGYKIDVTISYTVK